MNYIDLHCDTISKIYRSPEDGTLYENSFHVDLKRLEAANCGLQAFACFVPLDEFTGEDREEAAYGYAAALMDTFDREIEANKARIGHIRSIRDYRVNAVCGKMSALLTVEEGGILNGKSGRLNTLYDRGVRLITLTWNEENCIGFPNSADPSAMAKGLKPFGFETVEQMAGLGMMIDVSHLSDGGFYDVAKTVRKPFVASHSCARALCPHPRNLTDDMLKAIGNAGGVAGVNFFHMFLNQKGVSDIESIAAHTKYMIDKAGEESVAIGSDFDGIDGAMEISGAEKMPLLFEALKKAGLSQDTVEKIAWKNAMRVLKDIIG